MAMINIVWLSIKLFFHAETAEPIQIIFGMVDNLTVMATPKRKLVFPSRKAYFSPAVRQGNLVLFLLEQAFFTFFPYKVLYTSL